MRVRKLQTRNFTPGRDRRVLYSGCTGRTVGSTMAFSISTGYLERRESGYEFLRLYSVMG